MDMAVLSNSTTNDTKDVQALLRRNGGKLGVVQPGCTGKCQIS